MSEAIAARDDEGTRRRGGIRWERADAVAVARRDARRDAQRSRHSRTTRSGRPSDRARRAPRGIGGGRARSGAGREGGIWARGPFDARRTWRRTFATKRGSPLDATDFSSSATFAKSCREERAGGGEGGRGRGDGDGQAPARRTRRRVQWTWARLGSGTPGVGTHHVEDVEGLRRLLLLRLGLLIVLVFHLHVGTHRGARGRARRKRAEVWRAIARENETNKPPSPPSASKF